MLDREAKDAAEVRGILKGAVDKFLAVLKPCPFCGGQGKPVRQHWADRDFHGVRCDGECGTFFDCRAPDSDEAARVWNTRFEMSAQSSGKGE